MDENRTIRFVTPTFFFFGSLLFGAWRTFPNFFDALKTLTPAQVAAITAAGVAAMFPVGFIITGISVLLLRSWFRLCSTHSYQIRLSDDAWKKVWADLGLPEHIQRSRLNEVSAAVTFDHEILKVGTHDAAVRLWSAFNISLNSCTALLAAIVVGLFAGFHLRCEWVVGSGLLIALFVASAVTTWRDHMAFLELQCHRVVKDEKSHPKGE